MHANGVAARAMGQWCLDKSARRLSGVDKAADRQGERQGKRQGKWQVGIWTVLATTPAVPHQYGIICLTSHFDVFNWCKHRTLVSGEQNTRVTQKGISIPACKLRMCKENYCVVWQFMMFWQSSPVQWLVTPPKMYVANFHHHLCIYRVMQIRVELFVLV